MWMRCQLDNKTCGPKNVLKHFFDDKSFFFLSLTDFLGHFYFVTSFKNYLLCAKLQVKRKQCDSEEFIQNNDKVKRFARVFLYHMERRGKKAG
jgi:hypothetical protein